MPINVPVDEIKESINEMSRDELKESCLEFAQDHVVLKESAGIQMDSDISIEDLMNTYKKQGISWLIEHLQTLKGGDETFSVQSFIEIITEYSKVLGSPHEHSSKILH